MGISLADIAAATERLDLINPARLQEIGQSFRSANSGHRFIPDWREAIVVNLLRAISVYVEDLKKAFDERRCDGVAISARGLIELNIWVLFCNVSEENARIFLGDAGRDVREMLKTLQELYVLRFGKRHPSLDELSLEIEQAAVEEKIEGIEKKYLRVDQAAQSVGARASYVAFNRICSKVAHPTSMMVNLRDYLSDFIEMLYLMGESAATACVFELNGFIERNTKTNLS